MARSQAVIPEVAKKYITELFEKSGIEGVSNYLTAEVNRWKEFPINMAVTGESGAGKSSYINSIRGLRATDNGAATVGVKETTKLPTPYEHPRNERLKLWDLPGLDTPDYPRENYLEKVEFETYDFFIILSAGRFTNNDIWLAKAVREKDKKFFFVRTKVDLDIQNEKNDHPDKSSDAVLETIRQDCVSNFEHNDFRNENDVFLIDNHKKAFDFGNLSERLIEETPNAKKDALLLTLEPTTRGLIEKKYRAMKSRIWKISIISACAGAVPIPGPGEAADVAILIEEGRLYANQFGLTDTALAQCASFFGMSGETMKDHFKLQSVLIKLTFKGITGIFTLLAASSVVENTLAIGIPFLGCIFAGAISYGTTVASLRSMLDMYYNDALRLNEAMAQRLRSDF